MSANLTAEIQDLRKKIRLLSVSGNGNTELIQEIQNQITLIENSLNGFSIIGNTEKKTGIDAGEQFQMSIANDYLYICVQSGNNSTAIWKKVVLFQSV